MKAYLKHDNWRIIEDEWKPEYQRISESNFSLGNGRFGQRANFEEDYSGDSLQGNYVAGVYYPDKTRVGWWKNAYPENFAKVLNAPSWNGINILIDNEKVDLYTSKVLKFTRILNMKEGTLERHFICVLESGKKVEVKTKRFISIADTEIAAIKYTVKPVNFTGIISLQPYILNG